VSDLPIKEPTTITATQLLYERGSILSRVYKDKEHFVVEKSGLPVAAIIPVEEYYELTQTRP
jgi:prevent-host-death family protein